MVKLRPATQVDLALFTKVYNQSIAARNITADIDAVTEQDMAHIFDNHDSTRPLFTVIDEEQRPIGYASLNHFYGRPAYDETAEISIYLDQHIRGKGIGTKVMKRLEQEAKALGIHYLTGYVFAQNIPCNKLFEKQGYVLWGELPQIAHIDDARLDLNIWGKQI
ncbi:N-acetyltransferase family protein [Staphylococcus simulans]|uniref:GNAT family N-acetyltransferase n=1 Tax=Staphylococcus simulans TaxID=1286 RepID=UPI00399B61AF